MKLIWMLVAAMGVCASVGAQTIYKCTAADGTTMYSQMPCGKHEKKIELKPDRKPDAFARSQIRALNQYRQENDMDRREASCIQELSSAQINNSDRRISDLQGELRRLNVRIRYANNNLAGATYESGLRTQMGATQSSIATERASESAALSNAHRVCAERRNGWEADARAAAAARPSPPASVAKKP